MYLFIHSQETRDGKTDGISFIIPRNDAVPFIKNGIKPTIENIQKGKQKDPSKAGRGKALRQIIAALIVNLGTINTGMAFGFSATALPQLKANGSSIHITENQASWIGKLNMTWAMMT
jgi:facilitated trehalose transporter